MAAVPTYLPLMANAYHPATFQDRGAAVAFTTPMLAGSRVRDNPRRGKELVIHNPSGRRGVYVLPLPGVRDQYRPTVHDVVLLQRIGELRTIDPATIRKAALGVAREGFAGPEARMAAEAVTEADRQH